MTDPAATVGSIHNDEFVEVNRAPDAYRDMYGGAVTIALVDKSSGARQVVQLESDGVRELVELLEVEIAKSTWDYHAARNAAQGGKHKP